MIYKPLRGEPFTIPYTVPLCLQVSWKIHQTLVRPRFKDLFDLLHLLSHPSFDQTMLEQTLQALVNECSADNIDLNQFKLFLSNKVEQLFPENSIKNTWNLWRHDIVSGLNFTYCDRAKWITNVDKLPENLSDFLDNLDKTLKNAGFSVDLMDKLPKPTRLKRNDYEDEAVEIEDEIIIKGNMNEPVNILQDEPKGIFEIIRNFISCSPQKK